MLSVQAVSGRWPHNAHIRHWGESIAAVAAGVLLGVLAVMPYESWIPAGSGMSESVGAVVRSLIIVIGLTGLHMVPAKDLVFDATKL